MERPYLKEVLNFSIEGFTREQPDPGRENQDSFFYRNEQNFIIAAVFDGASPLSSVTGRETEFEPRGSFVPQISKNVFLQESAFLMTPKHPQEYLSLINHVVFNYLRNQHIDPEKGKPENLPAATATIIRIDKTKKRLEIAQVGDTICLVKMRNGTIELALQPDVQIGDPEILAEAQRQVDHRKYQNLKGALTNPVLGQLMRIGRSYNNHPDGKGQGVINGSSDIDKYVMLKEYPLHLIESVILLTDGLIVPSSNPLLDPDWKETYRIIEESGFEELYNIIFKMKESDPTLDKYPRWKIHDDATGILIRINR